MSDSYIFERRRIFRRRNTWSSRASLTLVIFLGAMFGYLLPEILSTASLTPPSLGERAYGQVGSVTPTGTVACEAMDCAGTKAPPEHSTASETIGQCKITGTCITSAAASGLELGFSADRIEMSVLPAGAR
ncbi:hypothetical protein [Hypericibacter sp.]|uniref:hypothetical protein n=1 Tax=Hypericibacter sp. TaxID=2705401 RepID=UPI003D6C862C